MPNSIFHLHLFLLVLVVIISIINLTFLFEFPFQIIHWVLNFRLHSIKIYVNKLFFVCVLHYLDSVFYVVKFLIVWTSFISFWIFKLIHRFWNNWFVRNSWLLSLKLFEILLRFPHLFLKLLLYFELYIWKNFRI